MEEAKKHINYALVEDIRPAMYKPMKYWGKNRTTYGVTL